MHTSNAISKAEAARARGDRSRTFDWDKAAMLMKEANADKVIAGLSTDMEWTSDTICEDGVPNMDAHCYLTSIWATPVIVMDDGDEVPCWVYADETEWRANTVWPDSALKLLND